jgi:carbonic anhydrase
MIHRNVSTDFSPEVHFPEIEESAFIHPLAAVIGNTIIGKNVMVSPFASIRGDEGQPLHVGDDSNVQDGVIIHALETFSHGETVEANLVESKGKKYAVYIGDRVSLAHQVQIHGPAFVGDDTFVGMKSLVFKSHVGDHCVIEPGCVVMGVTIADKKYVPSLTIVRTQEEADNLPDITEDYFMKDMNKGVIHVNTALAKGYKKAHI